ncbi:MAG TPA: phenylalanine--tRNA ligase subunit alpha, partial [Acidimicrobiales bacterium]|nr:phenylalanine--tRNA ligase subunit alpha [Acidimicrobiales bacterium]
MTELVDEIAAAEADGLARVAAVASVADLRTLEAELVGGKRSVIGTLNQRLGQLPVEARKDAGRAINAARSRVEAAVAERAEKLQAGEREAQLQAERLDLTEVVGRFAVGHRHLVTQTRDELEDLFVAMGYDVAEGPEVETDWYNFEALNMPPAHPARSMWDTLYVRLGAPESTLLRTHTSPTQIRVMQAQAPPIYAVMPGRCYRRDTPDARHLPVFHQIEGLVVDRGITFGDLAGTIEAFTGAYFGPNIHSRLRPSFFPFTEPSAEFEVSCIFCEGRGCRVCSHTGWIELGGCGMVDPNVFAAVGVDPEEYSGFAFGFGIDRCAMMRHDVDDIRHFIANDIRFL